MNHTDSALSRQDLIVGFPADLPADLIAQVDTLASRDALGQSVPGLVASYVGEDGRLTRFVWLPAADFARAVARMGLGDEDGGAA